MFRYVSEKRNVRKTYL